MRMKANQFRNPNPKRASNPMKASRVRRGLTAARARGFIGAGPMRAPKGEKKVIDTVEAAYVCDTTGTVTLVNGVATGTDFTNRIGRKTMMATAQVRGIVYPVDSTTSSNLARVMLVYDKQPSSGATPAITDILLASESSAFNNLNNRDRFVIVMDEKVAIGSTNNTATQSFAGAPTVYLIDRYITLNHECIFSGTGATLASISSGALYLVSIGNAAVNDGSIFVGSVRVRFFDE